VRKALRATLKAHTPTSVSFRMLHHASRADVNLQAGDYWAWTESRLVHAGDAVEPAQKRDHPRYPFGRGPWPLVAGVKPIEAVCPGGANR